MSIEVHHPVNPAPEGAQTWTTEELTRDFVVRFFGYGLAFVTRRSDGKTGTLMFNGMPRVYHTFVLD